MWLFRSGKPGNERTVSPYTWALGSINYVLGLHDTGLYCKVGFTGRIYSNDISYSSCIIILLVLIPWSLYLILKSAIINAMDQVAIKERFSYSSGGWKFKTKVCAEFFSWLVPNFPSHGFPSVQASFLVSTGCQSCWIKTHPFDLTLTISSKTNLQNQSCSEIVVVRTSTYKFWKT